MAASYYTLESHRDIQVLSPTQVIDVERVSAFTTPHMVYFERVVPLTIFGTAAAADYIGELADAIEQRLSSGLADSAAFNQRPDASGLIEDVIEFLISVQGTRPDAGTFTTTVEVPVNLLTADTAFVGDLVTPMFEDALARLRATAAL